MAVSDTLIGTGFDGGYRIVRKLGTGGMADVYLAEDQELGRRVAIKIPNDRNAADDSVVERFRREAKNAAGLSHPNIVSVYDRGTAEGTYYIAMEYLDGRSLKELIVSRGPAPVKTAVEYTRQILAAIGFAHRHGIVHRDIKPHNVLVGPEGRLKVTDFGIARSGASQMTEVGSIIGTAQYLSPEQARGAPVDQTSDLYSLGVVLYELLTGQVPFTGDTPLEMGMKHLSEPPKAPSELRPEVPHDLDLIVLRALAKDPSDRYKSAEEMDADLERVLQGLPVGDETAAAATAVLSGAGAMAAAPTSIIARPPSTTPPRQPAPRGAPSSGKNGPDQTAAATAPPQVPVPNVIGKNRDDAVATLSNAGLTYTVVSVHSPKPPDTVTGQFPHPGTHVKKGSKVQINVSTGPQPVTVPNVVGQPFDQASSTLQNAGFGVKRTNVDSNQPADTVVSESPTSAAPGSTITLSVSKGPKQSTVPDVTSEDEASAKSDLQSAGFKVGVQRQTVTDPGLDGIVLSQTPHGGTKADQGSTVTIVVGQTAPPPPPPTP